MPLSKLCSNPYIHYIRGCCFLFSNAPNLLKSLSRFFWCLFPDLVPIIRQHPFAIHGLVSCAKTQYLQVTLLLSIPIPDVKLFCGFKNIKTPVHSLVRRSPYFQSPIGAGLKVKSAIC